MAASPETPVPSPDKIQQPTHLVLAAVATIMLVAALGQTIVTTVIPTIVAELGGLEYLTWVITAYLLASTVGAPIYGKLGDLYGRKIVLQAGVLIFLAGSVVCGLAFDMTVLVIGRAIQGFGGGGLMVVAMAVVADVLPARERGKAQGLLGGVFGVATVIGPLIGGFLAENLSWHWIFFVNLPVGITALIVLAAVLKPTGRRIKHRIDYAGAALLATILSSIVLIASLGGRNFAWDSWQIILLGSILIAAIIAFVLVERAASEPVLPLDLFAINNFVVSNSVGFIIGIVMFGTITFMPLYLQLVKGVSPAVSGMLVLPLMFGLIGSSALAGRIMSATGKYRWMPIASTAVLAIASLLFTTLSPETDIWTVMAFLLITGVGVGPVMAIGVTAVQNAVPVRHLGVGTASVNMFRLTGGALGTAVFGAIFATGLSASLSGLMPGASGVGSLSAEQVEALPVGIRDQVLHAITDALHPMFWTGVALSLLAVGIALLLREHPLSDQLHGPSAEAPAGADPMPSAK